MWLQFTIQWQSKRALPRPPGHKSLLLFGCCTRTFCQLTDSHSQKLIRKQNEQVSLIFTIWNRLYYHYRNCSAVWCIRSKEEKGNYACFTESRTGLKLVIAERLLDLFSASKGHVHVAWITSGSAINYESMRNVRNNPHLIRFYERIWIPVHTWISSLLQVVIGFCTCHNSPRDLLSLCMSASISPHFYNSCRSESDIPSCTKVTMDVPILFHFPLASHNICKICWVP